MSTEFSIPFRGLLAATFSQSIHATMRQTMYWHVTGTAENRV